MTRKYGRRLSAGSETSILDRTPIRRRLAPSPRLASTATHVPYWECWARCRSHREERNMADPATDSSQPIFNFNAYSPSEIQEAIEKVGIKKANMPFLPCFML